MRKLPPALTTALLAASLASADGQGQNFKLVEESFRLPFDPSPPGTSTTDVDLVDVDGDGDLDLFKAEGTDSLAGRPNRLLINTGAGTFADETASRILGFNNFNSTKADFGDVDGDGDLDAIVANVGPEQLLLNDGSGVFTDGSAQLPPPVPIFDNISADARFADVDGDGDLDILVSNENPFPGGLGAQNRLFVNDGSGHSPTRPPRVFRRPSTRRRRCCPATWTATATSTSWSSTAVRRTCSSTAGAECSRTRRRRASRSRPTPREAADWPISTETGIPISSPATAAASRWPST
jgi:hypothetical protein